ncbi:MAG: hypothetical protein KAY32_05835 [Candidatus Eisenbacteria sp.]|nr:hypothetical protein [Candidatus Eisenbacteria bacterium]
MLRSLLLGVLVVTVPYTASAEVYLLLPDGTGDFSTIQAAIIASADGDVIELANGTFTGDGNFDLEFHGKAIVLRSVSGDPSTCTIQCYDGIRAHRGAYFHEGEGPGTVLEGVTITGGWSPGPVFPFYHGGAILCVGASPEIRNCIFHENRSYDIEGQSDGGAISSINGGTPAVIGCLFSENMSSYGGALYGEFSLIEQCTFVRNRALDESGWSHGGAVCLVYHNAIIRDCTLVYNEADHGSGLAFYGCSPHIDNTIVAFSGPGQAVYLNAATPIFTCSDLYGNSGGDWTGGITGQLGVDGNISSDPLFCWPEPELTTEWTLHSDSPCALGVSTCGLIGAWGVGCGSTPRRDTSWGGLKALFRAGYQSN